MTIIITNISGVPVAINDLGIYIEDGESIDLAKNFRDEDLLESEDLETPIVIGDITLEIDSVSTGYNALAEKLTKLSESEHNDLDALVHELSETAYFEVTRDVNQQAQYITHYTDSTKVKKIYEEEVTRDVDLKVATIIRKQYDVDGNVKKTEIQAFNRDVNGRIESIGYTIS